MPFTKDANYDEVPRLEDAILADPLGRAIAGREVHAVEKLLKGGIDVNASVLGTDGSWSQWELPMLHIYVRYNDLKINAAEIARCKAILREIEPEDAS